MAAIQKLLLLKQWVKNRHLALKIFIYLKPQWTYKRLLNFPHKIYLLENVAVKVKTKHFVNNLKKNNLPILQFIHAKLQQKNKQHKIFKKKYYVFYTAVRTDLSILKYVLQIAELDKINLFINDIDLIADIIDNDNLEMLKFIYKTYDIRYIFNSWIFIVVCRNNNLDLLKYLCRKAKKIKRLDSLFIYNFQAFTTTAMYGHLNTLKYLFFITNNLGCINKIFTDTFNSFIFAASNGHIAIVKFLYSKCKFFNQTDKIFVNNFEALKLAIKHKHSDTVKYLQNIAIKCGQKLYL